MIDKTALDRILIDQESKFQIIEKWFMTNLDKFAYTEFKSPMESGLIVMQERGYEITFVNDTEDYVLMAMYGCNKSKPTITWRCRFNINDQFETAIDDIRVEGTISIDSSYFKKICRNNKNTSLEKEVATLGRWCCDFTNIYYRVMRFIIHYRNIVHIDETKTIKRTIYKSDKSKGHSLQPINLITKVYVVDDDKLLKLSDEITKRSYTLPDHEVHVRGFYRTLRSGKIVWVRPFSRYKEKGNRVPRDYVLNTSEEGIVV